MKTSETRLFDENTGRDSLALGKSPAILSNAVMTRYFVWLGCLGIQWHGALRKFTEFGMPTLAQ